MKDANVRYPHHRRRMAALKPTSLESKRQPKPNESLDSLDLPISNLFGLPFFDPSGQFPATAHFHSTRIEHLVASSPSITHHFPAPS